MYFLWTIWLRKRFLFSSIIYIFPTPLVKCVIRAVALKTCCSVMNLIGMLHFMKERIFSGCSSEFITLMEASHLMNVFSNWFPKILGATFVFINYLHWLVGMCRIYFVKLDKYFILKEEEVFVLLRFVVSLFSLFFIYLLSFISLL